LAVQKDVDKELKISQSSHTGTSTGIVLTDSQHDRHIKGSLGGFVVPHNKQHKLKFK